MRCSIRLTSRSGIVRIKCTGLFDGADDSLQRSGGTPAAVAAVSLSASVPSRRGPPECHGTKELRYAPTRSSVPVAESGISGGIAPNMMMPADALLHLRLNASLRISQIFRQLGPRLSIGHATVPHGFDKHAPALEKGRHFRSPNRGNGIAEHILPRAFQLLRGRARLGGALGERLPVPIRRAIDNKSKIPAWTGCATRAKIVSARIFFMLPSTAPQRLIDISGHGNRITRNSEIAASLQGRGLKSERAALPIRIQRAWRSWLAMGYFDG
jgi:hypothetical protein